MSKRKILPAITTGHIDRFTCYLREQERSPATIQKYTHDLTALTEYLDGGPLTKAALIGWKEHLKETCSPASVNSMLAAVNSFLRYMGWQELAVKPLKIQRPLFCDERKELTRDEYTRLVDAARRRGGERLALGTLSQSLQTKEKDPSISAGIASGIGGVVPAAMTASRIERENQDIRARNAAIDAQFDSARVAAADAWLNASVEASDWKKKVEAAALKLTDDSRPPQELFDALTLGQPRTEQTETGAVIISLTAKNAHSYEVSGTRAVVDGAILADICRESGEVVGVAHLCLPAEGLGGKAS